MTRSTSGCGVAGGYAPGEGDRYDGCPRGVGKREGEGEGHRACVASGVPRGGFVLIGGQCCAGGFRLCQWQCDGRCRVDVRACLSEGSSAERGCPSCADGCDCDVCWQLRCGETGGALRLLH